MSAAASKRQAAREVIDILTEVSLLLVRALDSSYPSAWEKLIQPAVKNTHLDRPTLSLCVSLIENGIDPEALAVSLSCEGFASYWGKTLISNPSMSPGGHQRAEERESESTATGWSCIRLICSVFLRPTAVSFGIPRWLRES